MPEVDLGFIEECPKWKLKSRFFPSKLGGPPAWLDLSKLPNIDQLQCPKCQKQMKFLCQIYAPIIDKLECFHRTIFVFFCPKPECCNSGNGSFKVLRCQLPRENSFYPSEPPIESEHCGVDLTPEKFNVKLCVVCGLRGPYNCAKCKSIQYCSKEHQILDWKNGHKENCSSDLLNCPASTQFLLPEFEIITEPGDYSDSDFEDSDSNESENEESPKVNAELLKKMVKEGKAGSLADAKNVDDDLNQMALQQEDKAFSKFKSIISKAPDQVLRYQWNGEPSWISDKNLPKDDDIPMCTTCQGKRIFEFQILPQMLIHLKLDKVQEESVDWGILAVYTCENNCCEGPAYKEEFLWRQLSP